MKKFVYCLQNALIEETLLKHKVISSSSKIIRDKKELTLKNLRKLKPDFIFFPHWSFLVEKKITQEFNCICFHSTPLPYGRGGSPLQNMILRGHESTEVCSLLMTEKLDAGPIFLRKEISLKGTMEDILIKVYNEIARQIKELKIREVTPKKQKGKVVKFNRLKAKDNKLPKSKTLKDIHNKIRMLDSDLYPSAYIKYGNLDIEFSNATYNKDQLEANVRIRIPKVDE